MTWGSPTAHSLLYKDLQAPHICRSAVLQDQEQYQSDQAKPKCDGSYPGLSVHRRRDRRSCYANIYDEITCKYLCHLQLYDKFNREIYDKSYVLADGKEPEVVSALPYPRLCLSAKQHQRHGKCPRYACHDWGIHIFFYKSRKQHLLQHSHQKKDRRTYAAHITDTFGIALKKIHQSSHTQPDSANRERNLFYDILHHIYLPCMIRFYC